MFSCGGSCLTAVHCKPARVKSRGQAAMRPLIKTRLPALFSANKLLTSTSFLIETQKLPSPDPNA